MGMTIDAWIEYDDSAHYYPERAGELPFSLAQDNCIPLDHFVRFRNTKDFRFFGAIAGVHREDGPAPLFPRRGCLPPNVSGYATSHVFNICDADDPNLGWLTYPEIEMS